MHPHPRGRVRSLLALAAGLALGVTAGTLPTVAREGPKAPVVGLLDAIEDERFDELGSFFCTEYAAEAANLDMTSAVLESLPEGTDAEQLLEALVFDVDERKIKVRDETAAIATVSLDATLVVSIEQEAATDLMADALRGLGQEPSDDVLAVAVSELEAAVAGYSQAISAEVLVVRGLDDVWVICSPPPEDVDGSGASDDPAQPADPLRSAEPDLERAAPGGEDVAGR